MLSGQWLIGTYPTNIQIIKLPIGDRNGRKGKGEKERGIGPTLTTWEGKKKYKYKYKTTKKTTKVKRNHQTEHT